MTQSRKKGPLLICFAGIDGSGKTLQSKMLVEWMNGRGMRTDYVWNIFHPWLLGLPMKAARRLFLRRADMFRDYDHYHRTRYDAFQKTGLATCFHYCFLMEYMLRFCPRLRWPLSRGHSVVCDRYVFDAVIGLAANLHYSDDRTRDTIDRILRLMPTPDLVFLIDLPEDTAFHRKSDIPSLSYLAERRRMYLRLAEDYRMIILDGSRPAAEIQDMARDAVAGCFSDRRQAG